jgi:hypothetical protein
MQRTPVLSSNTIVRSKSHPSKHRSASRPGYNQADAFDAAGNHNTSLAAGDAIGGERGGGKSRAALAVYCHSGHRYTEACFQRRIACDVVASRALRQAEAKNNVLYFSCLNTCALDYGSQDMRSHRNAMGLVARSATGLGDASPAICDNSNVLHLMILVSLTFSLAL